MSAPDAGQSTLGQEAKRFARSALVYVVPGILVRGVSFFLTPLYTRAMEPRDFAIVAVSNSISAVLGIVLSFALQGCIPRLFFEHDLESRRRFFGTLLAFSLVVPALIMAALHVLGAAGYLELFATVPFDPYLKLVLWTSYFAVFMPLPYTVYMAAEQPGKVAVLSITSAIGQLLVTVLFVGVWHQGALGVLRANLVTGIFVGAISIVLMTRMSTFDLRLPGLKIALVFSIPLVPHLIANWVLSISDRLILDRYVPAADVGCYALGYVFSLIAGMVAASIGSAFQPIANRQLKDPALASNVPPIGTYAVFGVVLCGLGLSLTARELIAIIAPASYGTAVRVVPWVVLGAVFQGLYFVCSVGTLFSMKTRMMPVITGLSAALNISLNLVFVPKYGIMAAAVSTAVSYGASAILHGLLAHRLHPIAWEYGRWGRLLVVALVCYGAGRALPAFSIALAIIAKSLVALVAFPLLLIATRFFTTEELRRGRGLFLRVVGRRMAT